MRASNAVTSAANRVMMTAVGGASAAFQAPPGALKDGIPCRTWHRVHPVPGATSGPRAWHMRAINAIPSAVNRVMVPAVGGATGGVSGGTKGLERRDTVPDMALGSPGPGAMRGPRARHMRAINDIPSAVNRLMMSAVGGATGGVLGDSSGLEGPDTLPDMASSSPGPGCTAGTFGPELSGGRAR